MTTQVEAKVDTAEAVQSGEGSEQSSSRVESPTPENLPEKNGHPRRDRGLERLFSMHTKFVGEQTSTNKLILEQLQKLTGGQAAAADKKPELKDFEKPEDFEKAIGDWSGREAARKLSAPKLPDKKKDPETPVELSDDQRAELLSKNFGLDIEVTEDFVTQQAAAAEKYPDFDEVVADPKVPSSKVMSSAIIEQKDGADIQYYLSKRENRIKALELSKLKRSGDVLAKLAEIREQMQADGVGSSGEPQGSREPGGPIDRVGSAKAPSKKSPDKESPDEYFARRQSEVNKSRRLY